VRSWRFRVLRKSGAFDRQSDWYERMIRALHHMALRIDVAVTFKDDPKTSPEDLNEAWDKVQQAHIELETFASQPPLYGSQDAVGWARSISEEVQKVADETEAFSPINHKLAKRQMQLIVGLADNLRLKSTPLALEARTHLGIEKRLGKELSANRLSRLFFITSVLITTPGSMLRLTNCR